MMGLDRAARGRRPIWVAALMATTAAASLAAAAPLQAQPAGASRAAGQTFDIDPQPLADALIQFGRQAGYQVSAETRLTQNIRSAGVKGQMGALQALSNLLAGTGLTYRINGTMVALEPAPKAAAGAIALGPVQVEGTVGSDTGGAIGYGGVVQTDRIDNPQQVPELAKTSTALADIPASIHIIPREIFAEQGDNMLRQGITNASGVNVGGQDSKGFYDVFLIRGLNARIYSDGFSDGDALGGLSHSLNGVAQVEVLEGPGSALFGSGPPGGTINIVHYTPSPDLHYGASLGGRSFGTITSNAYITGPTGVAGLNYRADATFSHSDGFRDLSSHDYELRPTLEWQLDKHTIDFAIDLRQIYETPDSYGIIYFDGSPIKNVSINAKYSTPFAFAHSDFVRPTISDKWEVSDFLTINNRFSYLYRTLDSLGNGDSASTAVSNDEVVDRQARKQSDRDNSFDYQLEPVWNFSTGTVQHTLLTGFEYLRQTIATDRSTADLPNIPDAFAPVPPETSESNLTFLCDAKHSCDDDYLAANYFSVYATDQIDVTDRLKFRAGVREDWFDTALTPLITVPGAFGLGGQPLLAGVKDTRNDAPVSWNVGALYKVFSWASAYAGASESHLANFNSENVQNGIGPPEAARQYEVGIKFAFLDNRIVLNTAAFDVNRNNVADLVTINSIETVVFDSQRTKGVEATLDTKVTDKWRVSANMTAQNAVITDNPQGVTSVGDHPQGVPAYMANLWTTYDFSIAGVRGFQIGAGVNYRDKTFSSITNLDSVPSYVIANLALSYNTPRWGVSLNVKNITNERYFIAPNAAGAYVGEPLSAVASAHVNY
jgi:iron complex outermembrane receptor protein